MFVFKSKLGNIIVLYTACIIVKLYLKNKSDWLEHATKCYIIIQQQCSKLVVAWVYLLLHISYTAKTEGLKQPR